MLNPPVVSTDRARVVELVGLHSKEPKAKLTEFKRPAHRPRLNDPAWDKLHVLRIARQLRKFKTHEMRQKVSFVSNRRKRTAAALNRLRKAGILGYSTSKGGQWYLMEPD